MKRYLSLFIIVAWLSCLWSCQSNDLSEEMASVQSQTAEALAQAEALPTSVTREQALEVANNFLSKTQYATRNDESLAQIDEIEAGDVPLIYLINYQDGGFALVSGKTDYYPILAYSDKGNFTYGEDMHPELKLWLEEQKQAINGGAALSEEALTESHALWASYLGIPEKVAAKAMRKAASSSTETAQYAFVKRRQELGAAGYHTVPLTDANNVLAPYGATGSQFEALANQYGSPLKYTIFAFRVTDTNQEVIGPLLTTSWSQKEPYNVLAKANTAIDVGCVPIAMAQIMKYYKYPTTYNWDNMPDNTATQDTQELNRDIANALGISYSGSDYGAYLSDAIRVFSSDKYQYSVTKKDHNFTDVLAYLRAKRPVYMRGENSTGGHAWVCDGYTYNYSYMEYFVEYLMGSEGFYQYDSDYPPYQDYPNTISYTNRYVHMNWGWGGDCNGWYYYESAGSCEGNFSKNRQNLYVIPQK